MSPRVKITPEAPEAEAQLPQTVAEVESAGRELRTLPDGWPNPKVMDVWEYMQTLSESHWGRARWYLWRTKPPLLFSDKEVKCLAKGESAVDKQNILDMFGGEKFRLDLVQKQNNSGKWKPIYQVVQFEFPGVPPKLQPGERLAAPPAGASSDVAAVAGGGSAPAADKVMALLENVVEDLKRQRDQAAATGHDFDPSEALKNAVNLQNSGFQAALKSITDNLPKPGGSTFLDYVPMIAALTPLAKELFSLLKPQQDPLTKAAVESFVAQKTNPLEETKTIFNFIREMAAEFKGGKQGTDWGTVIATGLEKLPEILNGGANMLSQAVAARAGAMPRTTIVQTPANAPSAARPKVLTMPESAPAATPVATVDAFAAPPPATPPNGNSPPALDADRMAQAAVINACKIAIVRALYENLDGSQAAEITDYTCRPFALQLAADLKASESDPSKLDPIRQDALLAPAFQHPGLLAFAKAFVKYMDDVRADLEAAAAEAAQPESGPRQ